jgi:hypothetical protein
MAVVPIVLPLRSFAVWIGESAATHKATSAGLYVAATAKKRNGTPCS